MKRYSFTERIGTFIILSLSLPIIDSSANMSPMLSRIESFIFCRWRSLSRALRSDLWLDGVYGRKMVLISYSIDRFILETLNARNYGALVFPQVICSIFKNDVYTACRITVTNQLLNHSSILLALFVISCSSLRYNSRDITHTRH